MESMYLLLIIIIFKLQCERYFFKHIRRPFFNLKLYVTLKTLLFFRLYKRGEFSFVGNWSGACRFTFDLDWIGVLLYLKEKTQVGSHIKTFTEFL